MLLVCNTLWWACFLMLIRVCSSWWLGSNQSWCFFSGLPRYALAVLYTTCCRAAHSSSGVDIVSLSSPPVWREHCPSPARVLWMSILSRHLMMMKSVMKGCIQVVLRSSFCLNMVFVTISSNSDHRVSRSSPLQLHFPIPCLLITKGHLSLSLPNLALKSPISSSLSVPGLVVLAQR